MDFIQYISTPVGKTEAAPLKTTITLTAGRLVGGFLFFPRGPSGYLHFIAKIGTHQILPFNTGQNYRLNGCVVPFHLDIDLLQPPFKIDCLTWNDSSSLPHVLTVAFFLNPSEKLRFYQKIIKNPFSTTDGYTKRSKRKI